MNIIIKTKNLELTASLQEFIEEKIGGLKKFTKILQKDSSEGFFVEIGRETNHHRKGDIFRAEARVHLPQKTLVAVSEKDDLKRAIVEVKDELQQEIKKYKLKKTELLIRKQRKIDTL
ncbi:MAG: ribosomal subunit interface protein [Candidatus Staskawiczbacteria bacterium RIFCSPLOWO2_01_FULL_33_9]|uniref:Ribosomal subunit interface protein n=1 Tax=Candidatus Staskawiczbacteria bacterium RIFCSPLOWO2_01_FULL_33_9 TaxID=1802211 RepID=A0A1G2IBH0_9BACT|nr:MAG: ribosomal subunit interface protein [Candidatus Staskawiczbacteria bacterium RIFCSPLOWO2_01_FULL_33_9]